MRANNKVLDVESLVLVLVLVNVPKSATFSAEEISLPTAIVSESLSASTFKHPIGRRCWLHTIFDEPTFRGARIGEYHKVLQEDGLRSNLEIRWMPSSIEDLANHSHPFSLDVQTFSPLQYLIQCIEKVHQQLEVQLCHSTASLAGHRLCFRHPCQSDLRLTFLPLRTRTTTDTSKML